MVGYTYHKDTRKIQPGKPMSLLGLFTCIGVNKGLLTGTWITQRELQHCMWWLHVFNANSWEAETNESL